MLIGLVKWFNEEKGFGIVENPIEGEFFLHINNFITKPQKIAQGSSIIFSKKIDNKKNRNIAENCRFIGSIDDWDLIVNFLDKPDIVKIEEEFKGRGRHGNPFHYKETNSYSLKELSAKQLIKIISENEISRMITNYFDFKLNKKLFICYCDFIEKRITKNIEKDKANSILAEIYSHFGKNLNNEIIFSIWKTKSYKYIAYNEENEFEISEKVLNTFINEIGISELKRIIKYDFGAIFCNNYTISLYENLDKLTSDEISNLYNFLEFTGEENRKNNKFKLDEFYTEKYLSELYEKTNKLGLIYSNEDYNKYDRIKQNIQSQISEENKIKIHEAINNVIVTNCFEEFKPELWIKGILEIVPFEFISKTFLNNETRNEKRTIILSKLSSLQQSELLMKYYENNNWEKTFELIEYLNQREEALIRNIELFDITNLLINNFTFSNYDYIYKFKTLIKSIPLTNDLKERLRNNLKSEIEEISVDRLITIYNDLKDFEIILNNNQLLELLENKVLEYSELTELILKITDSCNLNAFRKIVLNSIVDISNWKIFKFLDSCEQNYELAKVIIDECYSKIEESDYVFQEKINYFKKKDSFILSNYFLDKFYKEFSKRYPNIIFDLAMYTNHNNAKILSYQNLTFNSENEIVNFILNAETLNISDKVKVTNKPLTDFIDFFKSNSDINLTEDFKKFLNLNKGIVQCLSIKFLIYQFYKNIINKTKLIEIINSYQWTEISALLIKEFIQESTYTEKILLDKLNVIFKSHFEVLLSQKFTKRTFIDNFTISNILKRCNGRKYYNGDLWQKNGVSRWYVSGEVEIYYKDKLNCYCEGRPWKKESFWDSQSNKQLSQQYEKYWCKTSYCAARNDTVDMELPFQDWTISEISCALNITVEKIALATLAGWVNRMNQIVEHLYCRKCNEVLRPLPFKPVILGYYAVPLFHCINDNCTEKQTIRFTHCLNGKCESHLTSEPLDSRDCESCKPSDLNHIGLKCNFCGESCPSCSGYNNRILV